MGSAFNLIPLISSMTARLNSFLHRYFSLPSNRREKGKALILFLDVGGGGEEEEEEGRGGSCGFGFRFLLDSFNFVK